MLNFQFSIFNERSGSSLAESMVALGLVVVGLLGIVALSARSLALNRDVVNRTIAAGLAAEGIEVVKNIVDTRLAEGGGWTIGTDTFEIAWDSTTYLSVSGGALRMGTTEGNIYAYDPAGTETAFRRTISVDSPVDEEYVVRALVEWDERGGTRSLELEYHFFDWRL